MQIFAFSDNAYNRLENTVKWALSSDATLLRSTLENHIVKGILSADFIPIGDSTVTSLFENVLAVRKQGNDIRVNSHRIQTADLLAYNGLVHVIDGVLLTTTDEMNGEGTVSERLGGPTAMSSKENKSAHGASSSGSSKNYACTWDFAWTFSAVTLLVSQLLFA